MLTLTNRIDMRPGAVPLVIHLGQYDSDFSLVFELYSSAGNFTVESGTTAMIRGTKTDGHAYDADATIDISAKTVTVAGSEQMTAAKGRNVYELVLKKGTKVLSTANFILDVERAAMDADTIASESVLKELNAIIAGAETATEAAQTATAGAETATEAAQTATAAAESVSGSTAQIATNTANIATNTADISDLKADFNEIENILEITEVQPSNLIDMSKFTIDGQYYNNASGASGSHTDNESYKSYDGLITVEPSTSYVLSNYYREALPAVSLLYLDSDGVYLSGGYNVMSPFSTPANAKYIRLSIRTAWYNLGQVMLEKGTVPSSTYIPYEEPYKTSIVDNIISPSGDIVCWGDSLTYGTGSTSGNSYPEVLSRLTNKTVYSCGFPGDTSLEIAGMQGAIPMMVKAPFTIPASGSVEIEIYDAMLSADTPFRFPSIDALAGVNPVTIGGIKGNLDLSASSNPDSRVFTFTRLEAGNAKAFTWYEPIIASCSADRNSDIAIIWVGTNGGWDSNIQTLANQIRQMINNIKNVDKKYIVIGLTTGTTQTRSALEALLTNTFGGHFVNARLYMSEQAIYDEDIAPTETDLAEMAEGRTPGSLRYDATHLNDKGYDAIATLVYNRGKSLGYWG